MIGLAKTGTGKTAAFISPIAHHLLENPPERTPGKPLPPMHRLRALVLCPTRELAQQVADEARRICQGTVLRVACAYGKVGLKPQSDAIARGVDLLIATPGRVRELLDAGAMTLNHIRHIAIDEADRMMDMGFLPQVSAILEQAPQPRQMLCFTATMPPQVQQLVMQFLADPVHVEVDPHSTPVEHVEQRLFEVHERDKVPLLLHLIKEGHDKGVLVFCRTKRRVGWVATALRRHGITCGMIHGDRSQAQRQRALERFAEGQLQMLVATDVAARGLHIPATRTVVNYDLPLAAEEYVHRIGRAGHGGGFGEAFTFLPQQDQDRWRAISRTLNLDLQAEVPEGFESTLKKPQAIGPARPTTSMRPTRSAKPARKSKAPSSKPRRKKQSRPIKKSQKPGTGVRRLSDG